MYILAHEKKTGICAQRERNPNSNKKKKRFLFEKKAKIGGISLCLTINVTDLNRKSLIFSRASDVKTIQ